MNGHTKAQYTASPILEEKLRLRKALLDITNRIHAAQNIKQILVDLKDGILNLFNAHSLTIYVVDPSRNEIYSMFLAGTQLKEIRVPIDKQSIAGYVASTGKFINIADAYDKEELKAIDNELSFDQSWDKKSGFRTKQILAVPVWYSNQLMGVIQILNKKAVEGFFSEEETGLALEIAEVLGVALYNQQRFERRRKTRFDYLIQHDLIKEEDLDIICPCDYRDPDLNEFGACYCGLYISKEILNGEKKLSSIPEIRPGPLERRSLEKSTEKEDLSSLSFPVWRCRVCGYLCAREEPPETCPICNVGKERFERFI